MDGNVNTQDILKLTVNVKNEDENQKENPLILSERIKFRVKPI